jgi:hypothetical protein
MKPRRQKIEETSRMSIMRNGFGFTPGHYAVLKKLRTPMKVQDFVDGLFYNLEPEGATWYSPRRVLETGTANCIEGAVFAAAALRVHGNEPMLMDLVADPALDDDHVVAVFRDGGLWGAIGKSKFTGLTYRNPVYRSVRELAMSYFEDYFNEQGEMSLRAFSRPVSLKRFDGLGWMHTDEPIFYIAEYLCEVRHIPIEVPRRLRKAGPLILKAGMLGYPVKS